MRAHDLLAVALIGALSLGAGAAGRAASIKNVTVNRAVFDPSAGEAVRVSFQLSAAADVVLHIYDGRDAQVCEVKAGRLAAGSHEVVWDGRDLRGIIVPAEAYLYTLTALDPSGELVEWDLGDRTGNRPLRVADAELTPDGAAVRYQLAEAARVRIRIGLGRDGPLLRTLIDWVPRPAGPHEESWDGLDASGVLRLLDHPDLRLRVDAFSLSGNTLLVSPPARRVTLIDLPEDIPRRTKKAEPRKRMVAFEQQRIEDRRDFRARIELPGKLPRRSDGVPVVREPIQLTVDAAPRDRELLMNERFEAAYFVDGRLMFENYVPFLPSSFRVDPGTLSPGPHYVTANLRSAEGHFGIATIRIFIEPAIASSTRSDATSFEME